MQKITNGFIREGEERTRNTILFAKEKALHIVRLRRLYSLYIYNVLLLVMNVMKSVARHKTRTVYFTLWICTRIIIVLFETYRDSCCHFNVLGSTVIQAFLSFHTAYSFSILLPKYWKKASFHFIAPTYASYHNYICMNIVEAPTKFSTALPRAASPRPQT